MEMEKLLDDLEEWMVPNRPRLYRTGTGLFFEEAEEAEEAEEDDSKPLFEVTTMMP
jgi:hypothetical protein